MPLADPALVTRYNYIALRERRSDIPLLAAHFIKESNQKHGKKVTGIAEPLRKLIDTYA